MIERVKALIIDKNMKKIKIGNSITVFWQLERSGVVEDLRGATGMRLRMFNGAFGLNGQDLDFALLGGSLLKVKIDKDATRMLGPYYLELSYFSPVFDAECRADTGVFTVVDRTYKADPLEEIFVSTAVSVGVLYESPLEIDGDDRYAGKFSWVYNPDSDSLDLVYNY